MKNLLCFGDSNTWGYSPEDGTRFPPDVRWTGVLQKSLGNDYQIISLLSDSVLALSILLAKDCNVLLRD